MSLVQTIPIQFQIFALVDSFTQTTFYVKAGGSGTNSGTFFSPLGTIADATAKMKDSSKDYTIFVIGTLVGQQTMGASIQAKSITLCGYNGLDNNGRPLDILNRNGDPDNPTTDGNTLKISTGVDSSHMGPSIKIKNLGITGGSASSNGGGLCINQFSIVEVAHGTEIYSNKTTSKGGGVYNSGKFSMSGGKIYGNSAIGTSNDSSDVGVGGGLYNAGGYYGYAFIYGDAVIGERKTLNDACANLDSNLYSNFATAKGGGIWSRTDLYLGYENTGTADSPVATKTEFSGGVFYNYAHNGGGIWSDGLFRMSDGTVSHNMASGGAGGIYVYKTSSNEAIISDANIQKNKGSSGGLVIEAVNLSNVIEINGNTSISFNEGTFRAGGFLITKGTVKLHDHAVVTGNFSTVAGCAGGVYINSNSTLLMYEDAVIGDYTASHPDADSYGNKAEYAGGVYIAGGTLALGYDTYTSEADNSTAELRGGILRNYAVNDGENYGGGGIYSNSTNSILSLNSGRINYNKTESRGGGILDKETKFIYISGGEISNNYASYHGGGMFLNTQNLNVEMSNGTISNNVAVKNGGGVYFANNPTYTFSGGTVTGNASHDNLGGAFYIGQKLKFIMKDSAYVDYDSSATYKNDIYLSYYESVGRYYGVIYIGSNTITLPEGKSKSAYITIKDSLFTNGTKVLVADTGCTDLLEVCGKFGILNNPASSILPTTGSLIIP